METKSLWSVAMLGMGALLFVGVLAFIGGGQIVSQHKDSMNIQYSKMAMKMTLDLGESLKIEHVTAKYDEETAEVTYRTRRFLTFAPLELDKELIEVGKYVDSQLPNAHECRRLLLIREEVTGGGCREQVKKSSKTFEIKYRPPPKTPLKEPDGKLPGENEK
jgi:hypothetical protein